MFIGRKQEMRDLNAFWGRDHGVLITCRGRRRIGKSTLIAEFASQSAQTFISIVGLAPRKGMTDARQRRHFCEKIAEREYREANTWSKAFRQLDELIDNRGRTVVLLDEISWMGGYDPDFAGYFKEAWDEYLRKHGNLIFVLCGSVSSWIAENILNSTGFVGRDSFDLELGELSLFDSVTLFGPTGARLSTTEKLDILSLTGGVPKYLEEIRPELTKTSDDCAFCREVCCSGNSMKLSAGCSDSASRPGDGYCGCLWTDAAPCPKWRTARNGPSTGRTPKCSGICATPDLSPRSPA